MPTTHINPRDAQRVLATLRDARRGGQDFVDLLHERDLLFTEARRKEVIQVEFDLFQRTFDGMTPEQILYWYYHNGIPRTPAEMFVATRAWIIDYFDRETR
jgi:hypothetical protein